MSRLAAAALVLVSLSACGDKPPGETVATGAVSGVSFAAPYAIYNINGVTLWRDQLSVLISDDPDACAHLAYDESQERPVLKKPDGSHAPSLWLAMTDHSGIFTDLRAIGDDLHASFDPGAPAGDPCGTASCPSKWITATRGSVLISDTTDTKDLDASARGEFALVFKEDEISGTFKAIPCGALKAQGCSCDTVSGGLFPALAIAAIALLRRRRSR